MQRKASPPRPTLLVGDIAACRRAYDDLKARVERALSADPPAPRATWQDMVPRFRALRESIVHLDEQGRFSLQAYELAAEACWRARDWGEFLKCIQQLLYTIYPRFYPEAFEDSRSQAFIPSGPGNSAAPLAVEDDDSSRATAGDGVIEHETQSFGSAAVNSAAATDKGLPIQPPALREDSLGRLPGIAAAHILYFSCVVPVPETFEMVALLRGLPPQLLQLPSVQTALRAATLKVTGDNASFLRLQKSSAPGLSAMARALMQERAGASRRDLMCTAAASFRVLPLPAAARMLQLQPQQQEAEVAVLGVLKEAAEQGGSRGASHALEVLQGNGFEGPPAPGSHAIAALNFK